MLFKPAGNWMLILLEEQRLGREAWIDGRDFGRSTACTMGMLRRTLRKCEIRL